MARRKRASQPLVVEECWPTKKARGNGCRKKRSVPEETPAAEIEPERVEVQTEETHVEVHTEETALQVETEPECVEIHTEETHVEVHTEETETVVNIQTKDTNLEGETEKIESLVCVDEVLKLVKKTKMISELVCVVVPKTRSA